MAKTSKTMASRKRPPPTTSNGNSTTHRPTHAGPLPNGIDTLLAKYARHLPPGGTITVQLIKGPTSSSIDPIHARRTAAKAAKEKEADSGNDSDNGNGTTSQPDKISGMMIPMVFPRVAKFVETVAAPDFVKGGLKDGRMYEEEVPKMKDESDEEESTAYKPSNIDPNGEGVDPNNPNGDTGKIKKKKRRWRRNDPRPRRWVLQEKAEFFDKIRKRRQRTDPDQDEDEQGISHQYHGVVESNASKYVLLSVAPPSNTPGTMMSSTPSNQVAMEQISIQPNHGFHTFSQPYKFASMTMEEAENAIEQQRNVVTRYMMHGKLSASQGASSDAKSAGMGGGGRGIGRPLGQAPKNMGRARLMGKLGGGGGKNDGDDDDVMGDVRYSSSSQGGSSRARRELVSSMGDGGMTVTDDGVLGGANNSEFGGRQRFARVSENKDGDNGDAADKKGGKGKGDGATSTGFEAGAMEEGFYGRDVAAEYEALDYDANEQFDDDDVNVGEDEMMDDGGGFGGGDYESDDDDGLDSDEDGNSDDDGLGGMATASGLKAMFAKARGDSPVNVNATADATSPGAGTDASDATKTMPRGGGAGGKGIDAAKKSAEEKEKKKPAEQQPESPAEIKGIEKDKDGKRLITLDAVRREIWLNNGAITSKRLMKKFDVTRKNPDRQALFKQIVLELCTMQKDADGNKLVLKQHYSKI